MKPILVSILTFIFFYQAFAQQSLDENELNLPEGLEVMSQGYSVAPISQCPRPAKKYVDMLAQLDDIRTQIKSEACKNSGEIEAIEKGVTDLQSLVTDKRKAFIDLIKKGTTLGTQLTGDEVKDLESYIDQVVKKASVVTGFLDNKACFDEPAKFSTLGTLSSVIGEISGAVGALAGPFGAKISLAGQVVSGLLKSINTIVMARKSYDPYVEADRVNYLNTLCAYYDFKSDFDKETKTLLYDRRLRETRDSAQSLLNAISEKCPDCGVAVMDFQDRFYNERGFSVRRGELGALSTDIPASELGPDDLIARYFVYSFELTDEGNVVNSEIVLEEPASDASEGDQRATVTALLTKAWAETERQKLIASEEEGASDELRKPIVDRQNQIEDVLFKDVADNYIKYHRKKLDEEFTRLQRTGRQIVSQMYSYRPKPDPEMDYAKLGSSLAIAFHDLFRSDLEFEQWENPLLGATEAIMLDYVDQASQALMDQFDIVRRQYSLTQQRCQFFRNSLYDIRRAPSLERECDYAEGVMVEVANEMAKIKTTTFGKEFPFYLRAFEVDETQWTADWLASVTEYMNTERQQRL